jgi:type IV pilus assembly protein PilB
MNMNVAMKADAGPGASSQGTLAHVAKLVASMRSAQGKVGKGRATLLNPAHSHPEANDARGLASKLGLPFVLLDQLKISREVLDEIPAEVALESRCLPLSREGNLLRVAMSNPGDVENVHLIQFITGRRVQVEVADIDELRLALVAHYGDAVAEETFVQLGADRQEATVDAHAERIQVLAEQRPVVRLVDQVILGAVRRRASDIHIRPGEHSVELIYRIDGHLVPVRRFSRALLPAMIGRIKILGGMDITERRIPQDGQARIRDGESVVDLRLSVIPTIEGESVVIRLLNTGIVMKSVADLGLSSPDLARFSEVLERSHGMVLVTGPTGSGKSTTLYAVLNTVMKCNLNVITIEEPVEYHIPGIEQVPIRADVGMTFAAALRNILRHDPDVIMVGEIRDQETAKIATQSALTGHLLLSTLHTNSAAASIARLLDMGVPDYMIRATLLAVVAQRLVRQNCHSCLIEEQVDPSFRSALGVPTQDKFFVGGGCPVCNGTGISGRRMTYELLIVTPALRRRILSGVDAEGIEAEAVANGMVPLTQHALQLAREGIISLGEAYRTRLS